MTGGIAYPLWRRVEDIRVERGWTQVELARRAGLPRTTIDNLRRSTRKPQPHIIKALARVAGLDLELAGQLAEGRDPDATPATEPGDANVRAAIRQSTVYSPEVRELMLRLVDSVERAHGYASDPYDTNQ